MIGALNLGSGYFTYVSLLLSSTMSFTDNKDAAGRSRILVAAHGEPGVGVRPGI